MFFALTFLLNTDMNICNETKSCNLTINLVLLGFQLIIFFSTQNVYILINLDFKNSDIWWKHGYQD